MFHLNSYLIAHQPYRHTNTIIWVSLSHRLANRESHRGGLESGLGLRWDSEYPPRDALMNVLGSSEPKSGLGLGVEGRLELSGEPALENADFVFAESLASSFVTSFLCSWGKYKGGPFAWLSLSLLSDDG